MGNATSALQDACSVCSNSTPNGYTPVDPNDPNEYLTVRADDDPALPKRKRSLRSRGSASSSKTTDDSVDSLPGQQDPAAAAAATTAAGPPLTPHTLVPAVVPTRDDLNLRRFKAIEYLQRSQASSFDCVVQRFQKMGGRIAPAIFIDATTNGVFQLRPLADAAASASSPTSESAAADVPSAPSRIDSTSIFRLDECMAAAHAPEWTATLLSGDGRASSPHENERPLLVVPVCHDGSTRSQVCHQALRQLQSEGRVRIDLAAPHAMLHGVDPFVAPVMSYAQFMAIATSGSDADFERETAWKYQPMSSTSVQSVDDSAAADFLFNSAFGSPRVPRLAEPALAAEFPGLDAKLAARDVEHTLAVRARVDALVYQQNLLRAPAAPNAVLASGKAAAVKRAPVATLLLAFNRSVHALVFRLLECALRSRSAGVSLRHVVVQPIMMPDPFAMAVTLNSDAPLKSARECLLRVMQSAAAGGR